MSRTEIIIQGIQYLDSVFLKEGKKIPVPPDEMKHSSSASAFIDIIAEFAADGSEIQPEEDGVVNLLQKGSFFVVSGPIRENRIGVYAGVVCGFNARNRSVKVLYINEDSDVWIDSIKLEDGAQYKWGIIQKPSLSSESSSPVAS